MTSTTKLQALCKLDVPLFGSRDESRSIEPSVIAARWIVNSHLEADELALTLDVRNAGIDVRALKNARVVFWLWDANQEDFDSERHMRFVGIVTDAEREIEEESSHVRLTAKDYSILFLQQKGLPASAIPEYTDTLARAWEKICDGTGFLDRSSGQIVSSVAALRDRLVFANPEDAARRIGEGAPDRLRRFGKPLQTVRDPWHAWTALTGLMGLHTFIDRDRVVVVRASEFYDDTTAPLFLYGHNIKSIGERVDTSKHAKGVCLTSLDPTTFQVVEAFWPPPGTDTIKTSRPGTAKRTVAEDYDVFSYPYLDEATLQARAREAYEERSRQELQGKLVTAVTRVLRSDGTPIGILDLEPGQGVRVEWSLASEDYVRELDPQARIRHLIDVEGYAEDTAAFVAENIDRTSRLNSLHHIRAITYDVDWTAAKFTAEIDYHNRIDLD